MDAEAAKGNSEAAAANGDPVSHMDQPVEAKTGKVSAKKSPEESKSESTENKATPENQPKGKKRNTQTGLLPTKPVRQPPKVGFFTLASLNTDRKKFLDIKYQWNRDHTGDGPEDEWDPWEHEFEWQNNLQDLRLLRSSALTKKIRECK